MSILFVSISIVKYVFASFLLSFEYFFFTPQVPGNPSLGNCGCRFHPQVVGKMLRLRRNVVQQEGGAHQADREVDLP